MRTLRDDRWRSADGDLAQSRDLGEGDGDAVTLGRVVHLQLLDSAADYVQLDVHQLLGRIVAERLYGEVVVAALLGQLRDPCWRDGGFIAAKPHGGATAAADRVDDSGPHLFAQERLIHARHQRSHQPALVPRRRARLVKLLPDGLTVLHQGSMATELLARVSHSGPLGDTFPSWPYGDRARAALVAEPPGTERLPSGLQCSAARKGLGIGQSVNGWLWASVSKPHSGRAA